MTHGNKCGTKAAIFIADPPELHQDGIFSPEVQQVHEAATLGSEDTKSDKLSSSTCSC